MSSTPESSIFCDRTAGPRIRRSHSGCPCLPRRCRRDCGHHRLNACKRHHAWKQNAKPHCCNPAKRAPTMVPHSALDTVIPRVAGVSPNTCVSEWVVPAITAVSNPKSRPPSAATSVLTIRTAVTLNGAAEEAGFDSDGVGIAACIGRGTSEAWLSRPKTR